MPDQDDELEPILQTLRNKAARYEAELNELHCQTANVATKLEQIQAAVLALQGGLAAKSQASKARANKRAAPNRAQLEVILEQVTKEKTALKRPAIKELVNAKLLANGFSRIGVSKLLDDLLNSRAMDVQPTK